MAETFSTTDFKRHMKTSEASHMRSSPNSHFNDKRIGKQADVSCWPKLVRTRVFHP